MSELPIGWSNRNNSDYCDPQELLARPKAEDWSVFQMEMKHAKQEEEERERLKNVPNMSNVPVGWASRENAKPLEELLMSKSNTSVAAAEAIYKKKYPNSDINDLLFTRSLEPFDPPTPAAASSSSSAAAETARATDGSRPPVPPTPVVSSPTSAGIVTPTYGPSSTTFTVTAAVDPSVKAEITEVKNLLIDMQREMTTNMGNLVTLVMEMSNRLAALEFMVEDLGEKSAASNPHKHLTSSY